MDFIGVMGAGTTEEQAGVIGALEKVDVDLVGAARRCSRRRASGTCSGAEWTTWSAASRRRYARSVSPMSWSDSATGARKRASSVSFSLCFVCLSAWPRRAARRRSSAGRDMAAETTAR